MLFINVIDKNVLHSVCGYSTNYTIYKLFGKYITTLTTSLQPNKLRDYLLFYLLFNFRKIVTIKCIERYTAK